MGFAISWLALIGKTPEKALAELSLGCTGATEMFPESAMTAARLPSGWFLLFANKFDSPLVSEERLRTLSAGCQVVSCQVEEHVMYSSASCHVNGDQTWRVEHDAQTSIYNIESKGSLPAAFAPIYESLKNQQDTDGGAAAEVDYIHDVPVSLAEAIVGFRHDRDIAGAGEEPFEVLATTSACLAKPWWKVW